MTAEIVNQFRDRTEHAGFHACHEDWSEKGAQFLTEPLDNHGHELRRYMRDPDGYLIEVGQPSQAAIDAFKKFAG
jgi:hypothetical protein